MRSEKCMPRLPSATSKRGMVSPASNLHACADRRLELHVEARLRGLIADARFDAPGHIHPPEVGTVEELGVAFGIDDGLQAERHVEVGRFHHALGACESAGSDTDDVEAALLRALRESGRSRAARLRR